MADAPPPTPLTDKALARLRKLADGNDIAPDAIRLLGTEEQTYTLKGVMRLEPIVEKKVQLRAGAAGGKGARISADANALKTDVERQSQEMIRQSDWLPVAIGKLNEQAGEGWGQDDVKIAIPQKTALLSASTPCPKCRGQRATTCEQCRGQGAQTCNVCHGTRYEVCYNCRGFGTNPHQQNEPCMICNTNLASVIQNGLRCIPCRTCQGMGQTTCPACQGRRGIPCTDCRATGQIAQDVLLSLVVRTHFTINAEGLPSGLRRGLDRLGIVNLTKGHADIKAVEPPPPEPDETAGDFYPEDLEQGAANAAEAKPAAPEIHYEALLPYADLRMDFDGKKAIVSVFGKRGSLIGVPPFLDAALEPARARLHDAATGKGSIETLTSTRLFREALALQLSGKATVKDLRRLYPSGLSAQAAQEIFAGMRLALNRLTRRTRVAVAVLAGMLSAGMFGGLFLTPFHATWTALLPVNGLEFAPLLLALGLGGFALSASTSFALKNRFADLNMPMLQKTGRTGYVMLGAIAATFLGVMLAMPDKPAWVVAALARLHAL